MPTEPVTPGSELLQSDDSFVYIFDDTNTLAPEITPWKILIVDDDDEIHSVSRYALSDFQFQERPALVMSAYSGEEANNILQTNRDIGVILLDVVMENRDAGLRVVEFIRKELRNTFTRIILRTGQPGEAPEPEVIKEYDINDYKNKSELTVGKLFTTITTALRAYSDITELDRYRQSLEALVAERTEHLRDVLKQLDLEKAKSDDLLAMMLPFSIAERMKNGEHPIADHFSSVTVLFADIVGFSEISVSRPPRELVMILDTVFGEFDVLAGRYGVEKIKTIGDACMVVGGAPDEQKNHTEAVCRMAMELFSVIDTVNRMKNTSLQIRIGIHTGEVAAGVIGKQRFSYDMWGDTVNIASRMESHGEPGKIHCSYEVYTTLKDIFMFEPRGNIEIKGKGTMQTWFLLGAH